MATMASLLIAALALWNTMMSDGMESALLIESRLSRLEAKMETLK
jgi:hypothetical protein